MSRNFGQTAALKAGIKKSRGEILVPLDADMQNLPADIPRLVSRLEKGEFDLVSGWRRLRQDQVLTRNIPSWVANRLINFLFGIEIKDFGCSLKRTALPILKNSTYTAKCIVTFPSWSIFKADESPTKKSGIATRFRKNQVRLGADSQSGSGSFVTQIPFGCIAQAFALVRGLGILVVYPLVRKRRLGGLSAACQRGLLYFDSAALVDGFLFHHRPDLSEPRPLV